MGTVYFERRISAARGTDSLAADLMRHFHTRQHLGKTTIICEQPIALLSASRKQWLKLSRHVQRKRAATLNPDKIMKYTHAITRMQHMSFTVKTADDRPNADVFFVAPDNLATIKHLSQTVYVIPPITQAMAKTLLKHTRDEGLIVDYSHTFDWQSFGLHPKKVLEDQVEEQWHNVKAILDRFDIDPKVLLKNGSHNVAAVDDALDSLLDINRTFIQAATDFHHALEIARPLRTPKDMRDQYDAVALLAHRVQALGTGTFTQRFLEVYNEDDTLYLYTGRQNRTKSRRQTIELAIAEHQQAGRQTLAEALQRVLHDPHKQQVFRLGVL